MIISLSIDINDNASNEDLFNAFYEAGRQAGNKLQILGAMPVDYSYVIETSLLPNSVNAAVLFRSE